MSPTPPRRLIVLMLQTDEPIAVAVPPVGACGACRLDLGHRLVSVFDPDAGVICTDCAELRQGNLERCLECGLLVEPGPRGIRMAPGGRSVHLCPASNHNTYALCTQLIDEREWRKAKAA